MKLYEINPCGLTRSQLIDLVRDLQQSNKSMTSYVSEQTKLWNEALDAADRINVLHAREIRQLKNKVRRLENVEASLLEELAPGRARRILRAVA